jgi:hypothetical protein
MMLKALAVLNQGCQETGVCQAPVLPPGVREARLMHRDDGKDPVLVCLWVDGAVSSCVMQDEDRQCCHSEAQGGEEVFEAWCAHLSSPEVGYHEEKMEVE